MHYMSTVRPKQIILFTITSAFFFNLRLFVTEFVVFAVSLDEAFWIQFSSRD